MRKIIKFLIYIIIIIALIRLVIIRSSLYYREKIYIPMAGKLNKQELVLRKGEEYRLFVYGINKKVVYSSTNIAVADVDFTGRVYAYNYGSAIIKAKINNKVYKCRVKVVKTKKKGDKSRYKFRITSLKYTNDYKGSIK